MNTTNRSGAMAPASAGDSRAPMQVSRTVYRCSYYHPEILKAHDGRAFKTERGARAEMKRLQASGYSGLVWRIREVRIGRRWEPDLDNDLTQPLDS